MRELSRLSSASSYELERLPIEKVAGIVEQCFGISDTTTCLRIGEITRGNLRLALLAAESVKEEDAASIASTKSLLDAIYGDKLKSLSVMEKKSIVVAALLGPHKTNDNDNLASLLAQLRLLPEEYMESCRVLHSHELMDVTEGFEAVSFEEQNLRDYFVYYSIIDAGLLRLSNLWQLRGGRSVCVRACQIVSDVYRDDRTTSVLKRQAVELLSCNNDEERLQVIEAFGPLLGTAGVSAVNDYLKRVGADSDRPIARDNYDFSTNHAQGSLSTPVLAASARFLESASLAKAALSLIFDALKKLPVPDEDLEELFQRRLNITRPSACLSFEVQDAVLNMLAQGKISSDGSIERVCLVLFAKGLFNDEVSYSYQDDSYRIRFVRFPLSSSPALITLRKRCIELLLPLRSDCRIRRIIDRTVLGYTHCYDGDPALESSTAQVIRDCFVSHLELQDFETCESLTLFLLRYGDVLDALFKEEADVATVAAKLPVALSRAKTLAIAIVFSANVSRGKENAAPNKALVLLSRQLTPDDWEEFFSLLRDAGQRIRYGYEVSRFLHELWQLELLDEASSEAFIKGYASCNYVFSPLEEICAGYYFDRYGLQEGRGALECDACSQRTARLVAYDALTIKRGHVPTLEDAVARLVDNQVVLPFASVCAAERSVHGFFLGYLKALCELLERDSAVSLFHYLPYDLKEMVDTLGEIALDEQNRHALLRFACNLYQAAEYGVSDEVMVYVMRDDLEVIPCVVEAFINGAHRHDAFTLSEHIVTIAPFAAILDRLVDVLSDGGTERLKTFIQRRRVLKALAVCAEARGKHDEVDSWLVNEAADDERRPCSVARSVIPSFPREKRLDLAVMLAKKGIDEEGFVTTAISYGFEGVSWSGSQLPLLHEEMDYLQELERRLLDESLLDYLQTVTRAIREQEDRMHKATVDEFINPYLR